MDRQERKLLIMQEQGFKPEIIEKDDETYFIGMELPDNAVRGICEPKNMYFCSSSFETIDQAVSHAFSLTETVKFKDTVDQ